MTILDSDLKEIERFLETWKPSYPSIGDKEVRPSIKASYKQFKSLLIWGFVVDKSKSLGPDIRTYYTECLSDLSHAYFLNLSSFYKSSRSALRSSIENFIRVLLLKQAVDIGVISSTFDLFSKVREVHKDDKFILDILNLINLEYGDLCASVHSAKTDYLSLTVPFEVLSSYNLIDFTKGNEQITRICASYNKLAFCIWESELKIAGHQNEDLVRDSLPKTLKRQSRQ
jgi:hypothetical protein